MRFFFSSDVELEDNAKNESEIAEYQYIPDISEMADKLKCCLEV